MINMLFLTRLKVLLRRKDTLFWILLFPILLASAEYLAFGKYIHSEPIDTIEMGYVEEEPLNDYLLQVFKEIKLEDDKLLYEIHAYSTKASAMASLEASDISILLTEENNDLKIDAKAYGMDVTITENIINQFKIVQEMILSTGESPEVIYTHLLADTSYIKDLSNNKNATFYTAYFYALMAMACLYAAFFGVSVIADVRADRSNLGIRISASVVPKWKMILINFLAALLLEFLSSCILYIYLAFILKVSLGNFIGLILLTLILGGIAGIVLGMLVATFCKNEKKCDGILTSLTLGLCVFAGLMSVDIKHLVDQYASFINYINPASMITNSLYALYYYDGLTKYWLYTGLLALFSLIGVAVVIFKTRGEKYASL